MHAFYLEPEKWHLALLEDSEFNHAHKVLRLKVGAHFLLFDGIGTKAVCEIREIKKKALVFDILEKEYFQKQNRLILAAAWTKAARRGFLFEKVVELEASELWLWQAQYSQFPLPDEESTSFQSWQNQLIAGLKQCHNPYLPKIRLFSSQKELLDAYTKEESLALHVLTTDEAPSIRPYTAENFHSHTLLIIGPEGGFAPEETTLFAEYKADFFTMGDRILRYETAAILALGLHFWHRNTNLENVNKDGVSCE